MAWEWKRGDTVVGTEATYTLTDDDEDRTLTLTAVLTRAGYNDATASATTATVATRKAPSIELVANTTDLRLGQYATLTWTTERATAVTGDWSATALTARGTATLTPDATGQRTYTLTATNANGTTTATVAIDVALPKTTLTVTTTEKVRGSEKYVVRVTGLAAGEKFTVRQGKQRATGTASTTGSAKVRMTAPG